MRRFLAVALMTFATACGNDGDKDQPVATLIHITDPHLFREWKYDTDSAKNETAKRVRELHENIDRATLRQLFDNLEEDLEEELPQYLVITGDFGIDTTYHTQDSAELNLAIAHGSERAERWQEQINTVTELLRHSPIHEIYWVPGNNDVAFERADLAALAATDSFTHEVAGRLAAHGMRFHNLTACYSPGGSCVAKVGTTDYQLFGIPTVSFKTNRNSLLAQMVRPGLLNPEIPAETVAVRARSGLRDALSAIHTDQQRLLERSYRELASLSANRTNKILLVTHIAELDDPYELAKQRFQGVDSVRPASATSTQQVSASAWSVSDSTLRIWKRIVDLPAVSRVLAGHFHDSHREIYGRPYSWARTTPMRNGIDKLIIAPPLSIKNQDSSPIQARGFVLVSLFSDSVSNRIYWLNPQTGHFEPESTNGLGDDGYWQRDARIGFSLLTVIFGAGLLMLWVLMTRTNEHLDTISKSVESLALQIPKILEPSPLISSSQPRVGGTTSSEAPEPNNQDLEAHDYDPQS